MMDHDLSSDFFRTYSHPNVFYKYDTNLELSQRLKQMSPNSAKSVNIQNVSSANYHMIVFSHMFPDMTMKILDSNVIRSSDSEDCQIVSSFELLGTILHDTHSWSNVISSEEFNHSVNSNNKSPDSQLLESCEYLVNSESNNGVKGFLRGYSNEQYHQLVSKSPLLSEPTQLKYKGTLTLHIDINKIICGVDLTIENIFYRSVRSPSVVFVEL
jgi:hypothetical protein